MTDGTSDDSPEAAAWPVELRGVTETVVTTLGPNDLWNVAALGVHAPGADAAVDDSAVDDPVIHDSAEAAPLATATTWGNTRTRRNFHRQGRGYVQFVSDPMVFVHATLSIREESDPVLGAADAWTEVVVDHVGTEEDGGTRREHWRLRPVDSKVVAERPQTINRGFNAVVEATVAASRLDVPDCDTETLRRRLRYFSGVARKCGGDREHEAIERLRELAEGEW